MDEKKLEELERRIKELEEHPKITYIPYPVITYPQPAYPQPYLPPWLPYTICGTITDGTVGKVL
jgi:hypothetical protein